MARPLAVKVLHIGSSMPDDWGGIERYVAYLSGAQAQAGLDVSVAAVPGSPLASRLKVRHLPVRLRHKFDLRALAAYVRLFRAEKFDVAVTHFSPDYLVPAWASCLARGPRMVLTRHVAVPLRPARAAEYRRLYSGFVGVSKAVADVLADAGIEAEIAYPGIPDPGARPLPDGPATACVVGRLVEEKGQRVAVRSAEGSSWQWRFVGSGPDEARLRAAAPWNVTLAGRVEDPIGEMAAAHAVVVPSVWIEAFGLVAVEAMAAGRCVVASDKGGLAEIVVPGETGLLVPAGDADALRQALETLDLSTAAELGSAGRKRYEAEFTLEAMERRITAAYDRILATQAGK